MSNVDAVAIRSFLLAAIVAGFTAAAYAEFSSIHQESGGGYMFVVNTFDSDLTYIMGWTMILGYPASAAFYLTSFSEWFYRFMYPMMHVSDALLFWIPGIAILLLQVVINVKGTEESNQFQIVVTALKDALLVLFLYGGLQTFDSTVVTNSLVENADRITQIGLTSAFVFITFFGFSAITTNAEEIRGPGATREGRERGESRLETAKSGTDGAVVKSELVEHDDVITALVEASVNHDLTIIGPTREGVV